MRSGLLPKLSVKQNFIGKIFLIKIKFKFTNRIYGSTNRTNDSHNKTHSPQTIFLETLLPDKTQYVWSPLSC